MNGNGSKVQIFGTRGSAEAYALRDRGWWEFGGPEFYKEDLERGQLPKEFVFGDYRRAHQVQLYRVTRDWGWAGRDWSLDHVTEYYQFYRHLTFKWAQAVLREHVVREFNSLFRRLGISAQIIIEGAFFTERYSESSRADAGGPAGFRGRHQSNSLRAGRPPSAPILDILRQGDSTVVLAWNSRLTVESTLFRCTDDPNIQPCGQLREKGGTVTPLPNSRLRIGQPAGTAAALRRAKCRCLRSIRQDYFE